MQFFALITFLCAAHLGYSHVISTTTVFVDIFASSTVTRHSTASTTIKHSLVGTAKDVATATTTTDVALPSLPLNSDSLSAMDSLMNLILSIPDDILQAGDADVVAFYTNISSCLANVTQSLEAAASNLFPAVASIADEVGSGIAKGVGKATSFIASLASDAPGVESTAKAIAKSIESKVTSAVPSLITKASSLLNVATSDAVSVAKSIESQVVSAAQPIITEASSVFNEATSDAAAAAKTIASELHLPFKPRSRIIRKNHARQNFPEFLNTSTTNPFNNTLIPRSLQRQPRNLTNTISQLTTLTTCLNEATTNNPLFEIGNCAFHLAELVTPASRLLKIKTLIEGTGGAVKVIQTLGNARDAASVVRLGGDGVLGVLKGLLGVSEVVKDCKFLVE